MKTIPSSCLFGLRRQQLDDGLWPMRPDGHVVGEHDVRLKPHGSHERPVPRHFAPEIQVPEYVQRHRDVEPEYERANKQSRRGQHDSERARDDRAPLQTDFVEADVHDLAPVEASTPRPDPVAQVQHQYGNAKATGDARQSGDVRVHPKGLREHVAEDRAAESNEDDLERDLQAETASAWRYVRRLDG